MRLGYTISMLAVAVLGLSSALGGCDEDDVSAHPFCTPGHVAPCIGPADCRGTIRCNDTGTEYGPCDCSSSGGSGGTAGSGASAGAMPGGGGSGGAPGVCLHNNCTDDSHCAACEDGRTTCLIPEERCVACDPLSTGDCPPGEECSAFSLCVPEGVTCPTDNTGAPQIVCTQNDDCAACSPMHQVCDEATGQCQACTTTNTTHCEAVDVCLDGRCEPRCPDSCDSHDDCFVCGVPGMEAHACENHTCAGCSEPTWPCAPDLTCHRGTCIAPCGIPGSSAGDCLADEDCAACGPTGIMDPWPCVKAPNAGPGDHGTCGPPAAGCGELGTTVDVLPPPYDGIPTGCSGNGDCAGLGETYDVGGLVRSLLGGNDLDVGSATVHVCNAAEHSGAGLLLPVGECAEISIDENQLSCGICVPCIQDSDCLPINLDSMVPGLFCDDPLASLAGAVLFDRLYGDSASHLLHFFCQPMGGTYGVCAPCQNPTQPCP